MSDEYELRAADLHHVMETHPRNVAWRSMVAGTVHRHGSIEVGPIDWQAAAKEWERECHRARAQLRALRREMSRLKAKRSNPVRGGRRSATGEA